MSKIIENSKNLPKDLKKLNTSQLNTVSAEIREALIDILAEVGGHVGPNLGIIEVATALHFVFDSPKDKIIWDVAHQSLPHKILTGRLDLVKKFHKLGGASAFTNINESEHDHFNIGHTSTSISLACGVAKGRDFLENKENVIAVIGDGSLTGGQALEGLSIGGTLNSNLIVIVNDNEFSMDPNVGGVAKALKSLRESNGKCENNFFKSFGYDYFYIKNGNSVLDCVDILQKVKDSKKPVVVHAHTQKGYGFSYAQNDPRNWHFSAPFNKETGKSLVFEKNENAKDKNQAENKSKSVSLVKTTVDWILENENNIAVLPASPMLGQKLQQVAPNRYIDVGIAEQTGMAFTAGMAHAFNLEDKKPLKSLANKVKSNKKRPYFIVAGTFVQRAFDQIIQDWSFNDCPATMIVFAGGISDTDFSHQGVYDIPMLSNIPNLVYLAPTCNNEYFEMLKWSEKQSFPVAIRLDEMAIPAQRDRKVSKIEGSFPKKTTNNEIAHSKTAHSETAKYENAAFSASGSILPKHAFEPTWEVVEQGSSSVAILGVGSFFNLGSKVSSELAKEHNISVTLVNPRFISDLDYKLLDKLAKTCKTIVCLENGIVSGGFGQKVAAFYAQNYSNIKVLVFGAYKEHVDNIKKDYLLKRYELTPEQIVSKVVQA